MKNLYNKYIKKILKNQSYLRHFTAFLIGIILISYIGSLLSGQSISNPDNPIEGTADKVSNVALAGSYSEQEIDEIEDELEEDIDEEIDNVEDSQDNSQEDGEINEVNETDETVESNKPNEFNGVNEFRPPENNNQGNDEGRNPESPDIIIVRPDNEDDDTDKSKINEYFTTTIKDEEIVTREDYSFFIIQKNHNLDVKDTEISLNRDLLKDFNGNLKLVEGKNTIKVTVTYEDEEGKIFSVSRAYSVYYEPEDIIIYTSLKDGMKITDDKPDFSFTAYAKKGNEDISVKVEFADEELEETEGAYNIILDEGENKVRISASDDYGSSEERVFTINYVKNYSELTIVTNLKSYQEVRKSVFNFKAVARIEDREADLKVTHNGALIDDENGDYEISLVQGSNFIVLTASDGTNTKSEQYEIMYEYRPEEEEDWEDPYAPIIETDLKDGTTVKANKYNIWVRAKDYNGNRLNAGNIQIKANSKIVPINWTDGDQTSYTLPIVDGANQILISVWDDKNNLTIETYHIKGVVKEDGDPIGYATFSIEANTVGLGYIIPPTKVEIYQNEPASYVLDRLLKENGFDYGFTGSLDSNFYLKSVIKPGLVANPKIPEDLDEILQQEKQIEYYPDDYQTDRLEEFDFSSSSGWMYSINGHYPNYGFADKFLVDGEVVRIRFTLAYGSDIGGASSVGGKNYHKEW